MYKQDLPSNDLQWLIYNKTQPNQIFNVYVYYNTKSVHKISRYFEYYENRFCGFFVTYQSILSEKICLLVRTNILSLDYSIGRETQLSELVYCLTVLFIVEYKSICLERARLLQKLVEWLKSFSWMIRYWFSLTGMIVFL